MDILTIIHEFLYHRRPFMDNRLKWNVKDGIAWLIKRI